MARELRFGAGNSGVSGAVRYLIQGGPTQTFGDHDETAMGILAAGIATEIWYRASSAHQSGDPDKEPYKLEIVRSRKDGAGIYQEEVIETIEPPSGAAEVLLVGKSLDFQSLDLLQVREIGFTTVQAQNPTVTLLIKD